MGGGIHGVNHVALLARNMEDTVRFYDEVLDIKIKRIANDTPGHKHYALDLGGSDGSLDFFEASPGTEASESDRIGALNHLALTADPVFIEEVEQRLGSKSIEFRLTERAGQKTIYLQDPNGITVQLYPSTGGNRA